MTPPEVYSHRSPDTDPDSPGWRVRVVPNKFPALAADLPYKQYTEGIHSSLPGFGVHEVVIETPVKDRQMADMDNGEIMEVLTVFRERIRFHFSDGRFKTVILFKNHGKEAGASLVHSHTQLMALPVIPNNVVTQLESFKAHWAEKNICLMCEILEREVQEGARVVSDEGGYLVVAPFASSSPFQLNIVPKAHSQDFSLSDDNSLNGLALVLGDTLRRLHSVLGEHAWNMVLHNTPVDPEGHMNMEAYHWFLEITPRLTNPAGFEMGSGFHINTVAPEECAALLREVRIQNPESSSQ
jgi:UDPglucose--hexose-1-phosphate uridylyltransferase